WDHGVDLTGKRVAVVGSGASAAQVIPAIASTVGQLHVFQRTPHWVMPRPDHAFSPWQRRVLARPPVYAAVRAGIYWGLESRMIGFKYSPTMLKHVAQRTALHHLERQVPDPELRAKLTPDFTIGCKRIILSNTLYPALARANVTVHAREDAIAEVVADGVKTKSGAAIGLDAIIWATGYDATDGVLPYTVTGRDGATLADRWADYPRAYLGTTVPGFPNLALVLGPNTGIGHTSALFIVESQMLYIARAVREALATPGGAVEPRADAEERYTAWVHEEMKKTVWEWGGCSSWYKGRSGRVIAMFPGFSFSYRRMTRSYRPEDHDVRR
ncbi:MAG: NAD(P)/FAD-dependent oxidoreductase, partial [Myxococcales bacterium]|nr:NAD(P)/FAD-dependent oxidoreductase [Myxococcales bacterium]